MEEADVIELLRRHFVSLFPMRCSSCDREFRTLADYIVETKPLGKTISYDLESGEWKKSDEPLIGSAILSNCPCGTTLSLGTETLDTTVHVQLLDWIMSKSEASGEPASDVLDYLRAKVRDSITTGNADQH